MKTAWFVILVLFVTVVAYPQSHVFDQDEVKRLDKEFVVVKKIRLYTENERWFDRKGNVTNRIIKEQEYDTAGNLLYSKKYRNTVLVENYKFIYDSLGRKTKVTRKDSSEFGVHNCVFTYFYYKNGLLKYGNLQYSKKNIVTKKYQYNSDNNLIRKTIFYSLYDLDSICYFYEYNEQNKVVRIREGEEFGQIYFEYEYDTSSNRVKLISYDVYPTTLLHFTYSYNEKNQLTCEKQYDYKGKLFRKTDYKNNSINGTLMVIYICKPSGNIIETYKFDYDENNLRIKESYYERKRLKSKSEYSYTFGE